MSNQTPSQHAQHAPNVKLYMAIFGTLLVLTVVTVLVSYWHLPKAPAILVGLMIATVKASLVAAFFMHLKGERLLIYGLLGLTCFFAIFLFLLPISDTIFTGGVQVHLEQTVEPAGEHPVSEGAVPPAAQTNVP